VFSFVAADPDIIDTWESVSLILLESISHPNEQPASPSSRRGRWPVVDLFGLSAFLRLTRSCKVRV
jgi:hypothetical protein